MSTPLLEAFLARIYVDGQARARFLADPRGEAIKAGLTQPEAVALERMDLTGLELFAQSLARKRQRQTQKPARS
jgi:hypothetical protein